MWAKFEYLYDDAGQPFYVSENNVTLSATSKEYHKGIDRSDAIITITYSVHSRNAEARYDWFHFSFCKSCIKDGIDSLTYRIKSSFNNFETGYIDKRNYSRYFSKGD